MALREKQINCRHALTRVTVSAHPCSQLVCLEIDRSVSDFLLQEQETENTPPQDLVRDDLHVHHTISDAVPT